MRIILIETEHSEFQGSSIALAPMLGKTLIERTVEDWVERGAEQFDIYLHRSPASVKKKLGDGERWGVKIRYHLTRLSDVAWPNSSEPVVVGELDRFPAPSFLASHNCCLVDSQGDWAGWARLPLSELPQLLRGKLPQAPVHHHSLRLDSMKNFQRMQLALLRSDTLQVHQPQTGIWLAPGARVHPSAELLAPVYLGPNCRVGADAQLGPAAVVEENCQVAKGCSLSDCWVLPGSLLSSGLVMRGGVLNGGKTGLGLGTLVPREQLLSRALELLISSLLLLVSWPLLLLSPITQKLVLKTSQNQLDWVALSPLPAGLLEVIKGRLSLLGSRPRSLEEVRELPALWQQNLPYHPPGLWGLHAKPEQEFLLLTQEGLSSRWLFFLRRLPSLCLQTFSGVVR